MNSDLLQTHPFTFKLEFALISLLPISLSELAVEKGSGFSMCTLYGSPVKPVTEFLKSN